MESETSEPISAPRPQPIALIVGAGKEPDPYLTDTDAQASWAAVSALWHPAILARHDVLPGFADVSEPQPPQVGQLLVVAEGSYDRLPSGIRTQAADIGAKVFDAYGNRAELVDEIRREIDALDDPAQPDEEHLADDFMALGTTRWWLHELTIAMGHADCLNVESLTEETLAAAKSWLAGDHASARNRLRAAFEILTQAREKFYPVDSYMIDICLLDPKTDPDTLDETMRRRIPTTFLAPAVSIDNLAKRAPERVEALREGVRDGWVDVIGGTWSESDESLLPWTSVLWQYRKGAETYRRHLDDRNVETWARRRFGLHTQVPQIAKRIGLRFALPMGFDAGKFPLRSEVKRLWESPDGSTLESLYRPPISVSQAGEGVRLPWRIGLTMKDDHNATLPIIHWTTDWADWYKDLRRTASYASVLMRWITVNDYFHLTDRPFEGVRPQPDDYVTPYLGQATGNEDDRPISRKAVHARLRAKLEASETIRSFAQCLTEITVDPEEGTTSADIREDRLELGKSAALERELDAALPLWAKCLSRNVTGDPTGSARPGYLVINPLGQPRRATVLLPDAAPDLQPEGPLRAAQFTEDGVWAVVELPAFGYAWVPKETLGGASVTHQSEVRCDDNRLKNGSMELVVDKNTGGIRGIHGPDEPTARIGQQLVALDPYRSRASGPSSKMVIDTFEADYGGPALAQASTTGKIVDLDGNRIASFRQRFRVWSGRPIGELDVSITDIDADFVSRLTYADPWSGGIACRWAWPDKDAMIRRLEFGHPWESVVERVETPEAIDVSTRRQRTALLFGGLAHHRRHSSRMLDTMLVTGREVEREFKLAVALDLEHPFQAASEWISPAVVVASDAGPPRTGPTGWLFSLDAKSVATGAVRFEERSGDGRGWGVTIPMLETAGRSTRVKVRCFRNPLCARQIDFLGDTIVDLTIEEDGFLVELTPHEIALVDVTLG